jgi:precorrin-3B synthase
VPNTRSRSDRCPGVLRPWPAPDGGLVRLRLAGGRVTPEALLALSEVAVEHGDGHIHLTGRANLQLRALPMVDGEVTTEVVSAIEATGLLPSRSHDLVRNLMASPQTGLAGGRANLRPVVAELDRLLCADPRAAGLGGRFLFVLDDGRGDLADRPADLGLVALDAQTAQLRVGDGWGAVVPLGDAPPAMLALVHRFLDLRGDGPTAPWHVTELDASLAEPVSPDPLTEVEAPPLAYGDVPGGVHVPAPDGVVGPDLAAELAAPGRGLVVTPWRGILQEAAP